MHQEKASVPAAAQGTRLGSPATQRTSTGGTASSTGSDGSHGTPARLYIVLVHGFEGSKSEWAQDLRQWRQYTSKKYTDRSVTVARFKFDMSRTLGDPKDIWTQVDGLCNKVANLEALSPPPRPCPGERRRDRTGGIETIAGSASQSKIMPRFIFIGHGLGCWIVRYLITQERHRTMIINTIAVIFLDDLGSIEPDGQDQYTRYLRRLGATFLDFLKSRTAISDKLVAKLSIIDSDFLSAMDYLQRRNPQHMECTHLRIWLQDRQLDANRISHRQGFGRRHQSLRMWPRHLRPPPNACSPPQSLDLLVQMLTEVMNRKNPVLETTEVIEVPNQEYGTSVNPRYFLSPRASISTISSSHLMTARPAGNKSATPPSKALPRSIDEDKMQNILDLATSCLESGDLKYAEVHFKEWEEELGRLQSKANEQKARQIGEVRLQRAIVVLYRGEYSQAITDFSYLVGNVNYPELKHEARRWLGFSFILQGDYRQAVDELEWLLQRNITPSTHGKDLLMTSRDLALAYAHLGDMFSCKKHIRNAHACHEIMIRAQHDSGDKFPRTQNGEQDLPADIRSIGDSICQTEAMIDILWGNYEDGLLKANKALNGMNRLLGSRHIKTLESAKLKAYLQAINCEDLDAEATCRKTLKLMRSELGEDHPQTLETLRVLVFIFRIQARLVESVRVGKQVCSMMQRSLIDNHPQWLDARVELGANYRAVGDYILAAKELTDVIQRSIERYRSYNPTVLHPSTLHYLSELAHVWLCSGYFRAAERLALFVLRMQQRIYSLSSSDKRGNKTLPDELKMKLLEPPSPGSKNTLQCSPWVKSILNDIDFEYQRQKLKPSQNAPFESDLGIPSERVAQLHEGAILADVPLEKSRLWVHPFLLHTLQVLAGAVLRKHNPEVQLSQDILTVVLEWQKLALGRSSFFTLMVEYELAVAKRDNQNLLEAKQLFWNVYSARLDNLGKSHPDTLSAAREWMITHCAAEADVPLEDNPQPSNAEVEPVVEDQTTELDLIRATELQDPGAIERRSIEITTYQEARLGKRHPETLKTLLWIFIVQLDSQVESATETTDTEPDILPSLPVRTEPPFPALENQDKETGEVPDNDKRADDGRLPELPNRSDSTENIDSPADVNSMQRAEATAGKLLRRLRHESVRQQRYLEATNMEEKMVLFYKEYERPGAAIEIRKYLDAEARNHNTNHSLEADQQARQYILQLHKALES